jgi:hypothetical protein
MRRLRGDRNLSSQKKSIGVRILGLFLLVGAAGFSYYYFVYRPAHRPVVEVSYVLPSTIQVVDTPAEVRIVVGTLTSGDRVEIITRTRNWTRIESADGIRGWVESKDLLDSQTYQTGQQLLREVLATPAQAEGHTGGVVNLRAEPSRDGAQLSQLPEDLKVEIYGRQLVERPATTEHPEAAKIRDAWYLIRAGDRAGWVLGRFVALDIPPALSPYAQATNVVAWVALNTVDDGGRQVPQFVVADRIGTQEADFSHIRVFTWWVKNHHYVTAYVESNLNGYFPIRVARVDGAPTFRIRLMDDQGRKYQKVYKLFDTITRSVGTVEGWESSAMPPPGEPHRRKSPARRRH